MKRLLFWVHLVGTVAAYSIGLYVRVFWTATTNDVLHRQVALEFVVMMLAFLGSLCGLGVMAMSEGKSESVWVAGSTPAAVLLVFVAC